MEIMVRNAHSRETDIGETGPLTVSKGDTVVYRGRYGLDLGVILGPVSDEVRGKYKQVYDIDRVAVESDLTRFEEQERESGAILQTCKERVETHNLDMRIVSAHFLLDRSKLIVFFVSEHRVDFRELVRDLVNEFHVRVELRQIGVRDETRVLGGIGICGRRICCNGVSDRLAPVSIRMAKDQNYSLNSMKVSGPCGRLLCCLSYEHSFYQEERRNFPREGALVDVEGDTFRVQEINILSGQIRMSGPEGRYISLPICAFLRQSAPGRQSGKRRSVEWLVKTENCPAVRTAVDTA